MEIRIIDQPISNDELRAFLGNPFSDMVKFVVDIEKEVIALGGSMHADAETVLLQNGFKQKDIWGANIYPDKKEDPIEYESLINIRPADGNRSLVVQDQNIRNKIQQIVKKLIVV